GSTVIPGWTTRQAELGWVDNQNTFTAFTPFGAHHLELTGYHDGLPFAGVSQTISTVPDQTYRLSFALGSNADYPRAAGLKAVSVCAGSTAAILTFVPTNTSGSQWETVSTTFTALADSTEIVINGLISSGNYLALDNVSVVREVIPGPDENLVINGSF